MKELITVNVKVYGQEFKIKAQENEVELIHKAADLATKRMQQISESGIVSIHRVAIMAAFQFAYELMQTKESAPPSATDKRDINNRVDHLISRIDEALR
jgi:cell division protein ZapA (FtsZ GTPase activity inhibitor)